MDIPAAPPISDRLEAIGINQSVCRAFESRRDQSARRLEEFAHNLSAIPSVKEWKNLTVYAAGSHARGDASEHSDVDLWFLEDDCSSETAGTRRRNISTIQVMSAVIDLMNSHGFPQPSNDGEYLTVLSLKEVLTHLGNPPDDFLNHFTARMLLLLESKPLSGVNSYNRCLDAVISAYLRDYKHHAADFRPNFLVNDILRYWRTLCLNYEHRRNDPKEADKLKHKVKNFKLGFSRMLICFSAVALISSRPMTDKDGLIRVFSTTPLERLLVLGETVPTVAPKVADVICAYNWFLEKTAQPPESLEQLFSDSEQKRDAFSRSKEFGDKIYDLV